MQIYRFMWHEGGAGSEDWFLVTAVAAAVTTILSVFLSSGGGDYVLDRLRRIIVTAVEDIGSDTAAEAPLTGMAPIGRVAP